jgi:AraC-like DNA-binding protein
MAEGEGQAPMSFRVSTETLPERERMAIWREEFSRVMFKLDVDPIGLGPFKSELTVCALPGLAFFSGYASPAHFRGSPSLAAANGDTVAFSRTAVNGAISAHRGLETTLTVGEATLVCCPEPINYTVPDGCFKSSVRLSRPVLMALAPGLEDAYNKPIPQQNEALSLLFSYLKALEDQRAASTPELQHAVVTHIYDLAALALGASRDSAEVAKERGLRAARLQAIKDDIEARLSEPGLSLESVTLRHRVSPRYVQKLFELEGTSFSDYVRARRLARVYRILQDPRQVHLNISTIAYDCGFGDVTAFNRAFRRHYNAAPSDVRFVSKAS